MFADLVEQSFGHDVVELVISRVIPVLDPTLNNTEYQHFLRNRLTTSKPKKTEREKKGRTKESGTKYPHHSTTLPPEEALVVLAIGCIHLRKFSRTGPRLLIGV